VASNLATSEIRRARCRPFDALTGHRIQSADAERPRDLPELEPKEPIDVSADVPETVWLAEQRRLVGASLRRLPPEQREAVELAYFGGLTHAEIAATQGAPLSTVKTRLALGLRKLAGFLTDEGLAPAFSGPVGGGRRT
jgi:RNA polymerase sigma-70 factor (ECF subfamily)